MFLSVCLIVIFPEKFLRSESTISFEIMEIFGLAVLLFGQILRISARGYKSEHSKNGNSLVMGGPYSMVRNPMYLGILLTGIGMSLVLFQWWVIGLFSLVFIVRYLTLMDKEEKILTQIFGKEYTEYKNKVPRFLPSGSTLFKKEAKDYLPMKLSWVKKEIGSIIAVLLGIFFLEVWRDFRSQEALVFFKELLSMIMVVGLFIVFVIYLTRSNKDATN